MFKSILKLSRPIHLLLAVLSYTLGAGIAHYLGKPILTASFGLGMLALLALLEAATLFDGYFQLFLMPLVQGETFRQRARFQVTLLQVAYAALTLSVVSILTLFLTHSLNLSADILFGVAFLLLVAYAIPPMRLSEAGYGELVLAVTLGTIIPALAFLFQYGQLHRLLSFTTFPLTLLALAYLLICNFPAFATDQKLGRHTLLTRLTWQRAVPVHHFLILGAFLLFAAEPFLEYPWGLVWPVFLAIPLAAAQIISLQRIANGGHTLWTFLITLASATYIMTAYLLALTFWIR
jgi:1,4-dihydroxy-2-naphthoate octaprenyltransferase